MGLQKASRKIAVQQQQQQQQQQREEEDLDACKEAAAWAPPGGEYGGEDGSGDGAAPGGYGGGDGGIGGGGGLLVAALPLRANLLPASAALKCAGQATV